MINVKGANSDDVNIFALGFGESVDFSFLTKLALQNGGMARKIYTNADATLQLEVQSLTA